MRARRSSNLKRHGVFAAHLSVPGMNRIPTIPNPGSQLISPSSREAIRCALINSTLHPSEGEVRCARKRGVPSRSRPAANSQVASSDRSSIMRLVSEKRVYGRKKCLIQKHIREAHCSDHSAHCTWLVGGFHNFTTAVSPHRHTPPPAPSINRRFTSEIPPYSPGYQFRILTRLGNFPPVTSSR